MIFDTMSIISDISCIVNNLTTANLKTMEKQSTQKDIKLAPEELKRLCDYIELLMKIDQRNKAKKARQGAILSLLKTIGVVIHAKAASNRDKKLPKYCL